MIISRFLSLVKKFKDVPVLRRGDGGHTGGGRASGRGVQEDDPIYDFGGEDAREPDRGGGRRSRPRAGGPGGGRYRRFPRSALRLAGRRRGIREIAGRVVTPGGCRAGEEKRGRGREWTARR